MSRAKVARRKTREVLDKSRTDADAAALGLATASSRKKRKGENLERITAIASTKTPNQPNELVRDVTTGREHAPGYLRRIGCRISTFTKMLAKGVAMIRQDAAVPHDFPDHVLAVYQRYLAACNVAFTSIDYTEDLEVMFRALVLNTNMWDTPLFTIICLENGFALTEGVEFNSEMPTTSETPKKPRMVTVVDTKIPKEALQNASAILLSVDSLAAILYVSVVTIGCRWILLSDILRWMREGRFGITLFQLTALVPRALEKIEKTGKSPYTKLNFPLHEFLRTALFVWQLCRLPPIPVKVDFEQAVARLLYHLNLPEVLMEHVLLLIEKARPCLDLDDEALRRQGRMEQGPFSHGFSFDPRDRKKKTFMLTAFGRPRPTKTNRNSDIFFSTETKALAFILMALKLCFGLDDVREYRVNKETENSTATRFTFIQWFYQLKMRIMHWEGHDPLDVFQMK
ncbi:unnamed protein product [Heligmosomoides polygyrus]|uniref:Rrn7/TAF1B C-terminal cyclin domain-containing protein n=1 Tax=Heligmosomoides polygyrus TaxID=6339 RepID=A0A3P8CMR6_HELPZ|nr:unnamed protein product [Heligmosomoides polygyrus]